jgi:error-prone DNA polymerase
MSDRIRIDPGSRMPLDPVPEPQKDTESPHPPSPYVELGMRSNYSFLQAASPPEALVEKARALGYDAVSLTDRDGFYGMVRALERCRRMKVRLIVGAELTVSETGVLGPYRTVRVHVATPEGYRLLCRLLTRSHALHPKGKPRKKVLGLPRNLYAGLPFAELFAAGRENAGAGGGLWVMAGHEPRVSDHHAGEDERFLRGLRDAFGERASVSVHLHKDGWDRRRVEWAQDAEARFGLPGVAIGHVLYAEREGKTLYDVLHCIGEGVTLDEAGRRLSPNAEARLKTPAEMGHAFRDHPEWIARTRTIADACTFDLGSIKYKFPCELEEPAYPGETPDEAIRRLTYEGARAHHKTETLSPEVEKQIEAELALIAKMEVAPYFLSVRTIVDMAREKDILCQGRGSAANSAVCHALGITAIDPVRSKFLFARFLSEERHEPPDIDVDFEHERREEVIQEIYRRYGRKRAAMVSEVICYRGKSALRDVGKVFGLTLEQVERLSTVVTYWDRLTSDIDDRLAAAGFDPKDSRIRLLLTVASALQGFPRHLSIHVGGFVLSSEDLENVAPIEPATMKDRTVIPWDKDDIDVLGFFKVDVLGLGMLTALRRTFQLLGQTSGPEKKFIDHLREVPAEDPAVYEALQRSDSVGVFQVESRAQMAMLPRLKPTKFYDLVVEVAIVRPGPIQGGMIHPYLRRRSGEEKPDPPHPVLDDILERTLGVPLFQEQVMQIAIHGAGYTGGEADQLRRDMAAWRKNGNMDAHKERLARGFAERGIPEAFSQRLYEQIKGFGEYGFPESHAASFALLVYASAYLKVHHPAAFAAALVNSQPMGFYSSSTLLEDAKRHGVVVLPVRIDVSRWDCQLEGDEPAIRLGLRLVNGLGEDVGKRIDAARAQGSFVSVEDLACRAELDAKVLDALAESGALEPLVRAGGGRREAMWRVRAPLVRARAGELFAGLPEHDAPSLVPRLVPLGRDELLALDYARTGVSVGDHPMKLLRPRLPPSILGSRAILDEPDGRIVSVGGMVICRQRPGTASGVVFFTLEDEDGFLNVVLYNRVYEQFRHVALNSPLLLVRGKVQKERPENHSSPEPPLRIGAVIHVVAEHLEPLTATDATPSAPTMAADLHAMSRNFH